MRTGKRHLLRALLTISIVSLAVANQAPDTPKPKATARVTAKGRVVDRDGKGIANAEVTLTGPTKTKTTTDSDGFFTREVIPGKYKITAKSGSRSKGIESDIQSDTSDLSLVLE